MLRDQGTRLTECRICRSDRLRYAFSRDGLRLEQCEDCGLLFQNPQPSDEELAKIYSQHYFLTGDTETDRAITVGMKRRTAERYLDLIRDYAAGGRLLEVGCGEGDLLQAARDAGFDVVGVEINEHAAAVAENKVGPACIYRGDLSDLRSADPFDVCVLSDVIEHTRDPLAMLAQVQTMLRPDGVLFMALPSLDSWSARLLKSRWMEFKEEHLFHFDRNTVENALFAVGFERIVLKPGVKVLTLEYVARHFQRFPVRGLTTIVTLVTRLVPRAVRRHMVTFNPSGMIVLARRGCRPARRKLSIIVPLYNERRTFRELMSALLGLELPGLDKEIIIVESNSSDGSREEALSYSGMAGVRVVLEDRPRGKGHAVRTGFQHATGDFLLIQDADLEYDVNDYDALLRPLVRGHRAFVLGSRHSVGGVLKMRVFVGQPLLALFLNAGHWVFTSMINVLFGQRLRDPFTMFKVFRRECLSGLHLECNRFDFDFELLIKLLRKGYRPVEIPVNYVSRSFAEGKKVSMLRDPLTWIRALVKYRFAPLDR